MLGEAALTRRRRRALSREILLGHCGRGQRAVETRESITARHSISIKLSALHPRYEFAQAPRVMARAVSRHRTARAPRRATPASASRSMPKRPNDSSCRCCWSTGCSQATSRAATRVSVSPCRPTRSARMPRIEWLIGRLRDTDRRITLRLVKGAYWDSEIKRAQERGLAGYPVFTRKPNTDVSYLACARLLESAGERIYPQFATHNAHTIAHVAEVVRRRRQPIRVPAPARHGRRALRQRGARALGTGFLPRVRAGGRARRPAAVPGTPPARERRQHLVRQSHRRCEPARRRSGGRSDRRSRCARARGASAHSVAREPVRARAC